MAPGYFYLTIIFKSFAKLFCMLLLLSINKEYLLNRYDEVPTIFKRGNFSFLDL